MKIQVTYKAEVNGQSIEKTASAEIPDPITELSLGEDGPEFKTVRGVAAALLDTLTHITPAE